MTDREERQHVIEVLKSWDGYFIGYTSDEVQEALRYAIASIETDLRYDLLYEETSGQADKPTTKDYLGVDYLGVDAISRQAINGYIDYILSHGMGKKKSFDFIKKFVANMPSVTPQEPKTGHCKNCKFFELNSWAACGGIPIIVAHEICKAWGEGCKTKEDGYCFLFEPKESEVEE